MSRNMSKTDDEDKESGIELEEMECSSTSKKLKDFKYQNAPETVFYCLKQDSFPRNVCLKIVNNPWCDRLTMLVIILNCVFMAMYQPCEDDECYTVRCHALQVADYLIFAYFVLEMILKMIASGILGPKTYLTDSWNRLDCFIVVSGAASFVIEAKFSSEIDLTVFRTIRVLRPLRAVNRVSSLRVVVTLLIDTLPMVINVLALFLVFFFIFGFIGIQMWSGALRWRCSIGDSDLKSQMIALGHSNIYEDPFIDEYLCSSNDQSGQHSTCNYTAPSYSGDVICSESLISWTNQSIVYPKIGSNSCVNWNQYYDTCTNVGQNPYYGSISFDHFGKAFVTIFVVMSMEGWSDIMYYVQDAASFWSWIYFVILIVAGSFFMLNLFLVVFSVQFAETRKNVEESMKKESKQLKMSASRKISGSVKRNLTQMSHLEQLDEECLEAMTMYSAIVECFFSIPHMIRTGLERCPIKKCRLKPQIRPEPLTPGPMRKGAVSIAVQTENKENFLLKFRLKVRRLIESSKFRWFIMVAILLNTLTLAVEHHNQPDEMTQILDYCNIIFTVFFSMEMILKIFGLGFHDYAIDPFNLFDATIVIVSIVDVLQDGGSGLSVLRTLRLLRIVKLIRFMPALRHQIGCMVSCLDEVAVFFMVMLLFVLILSLMGTQLFGRKLCFKSDNTACDCDELVLNSTLCDCSRMNFDNFANASLTVFQILTTEDWNEVLFNSMNSVGDWSFLYFLIVIVIGNFILLNLLVAILVDGVDKHNKIETEEKRVQKVAKRLESIMHVKIEVIEPTSAPIIGIVAAEEERERERESVKLWTTFLNSEISRKRGSSSEKAVCYKDLMMKYKLHPKRNSKLLVKAELKSGAMKFKLWFLRLYHESCFYKLRHYSLWILSPENCLREFCLALVNSASFDNCVLVLIFANCIFMAIERPSIEHGSLEDKIVTYSGYFFTGCFTVELIIKIMAWGLILGEGAYLRSSWNVLDAILVGSSLFYLGFMLFSTVTVPSVLSVLRVLRVLRALRPLRVINRAPGLKVTLESLMGTFKYIGNVLLICAVFYIIFGILAVQLYKGTMYYCDGPDTSHISTKEDCLMNNKTVWQNAKYNFDDLGQALLTLFVMSTIDGWVVLMQQIIDAVDVDMQPVAHYNEWGIVFCVIFLIITSFLILNMFVCVLVESYTKTHAEMKAAKLLEAEQQTDGRTKMNYLENSSNWRASLFWFVRHRHFNTAVLVVVLVHAIALCTVYYNMSEVQMRVLDYCSYIFAGLYILELFLNILAYTPCWFVKSGWHINDILLVVSMIVGITLDTVLDTTGLVYKVMVCLRVAQAIFLCVKLLRTATGLRSLVDTVLRTLPQVGNLTLLFFLLFFIFAALGVELFGLSGCDANHPCDGLGEHATFENFGMAFLTLFRISTGDNWNGILKDALRSDCDDSSDCSEFCCVDSVLATLYFVLFVVFSQFILLNIVVAMLLKGFEETTDEEREEREEEQRQEELSKFKITAQEIIEEEEEETEKEDEGEKVGEEEKRAHFDIQIRITNHEMCESEML